MKTSQPVKSANTISKTLLVSLCGCAADCVSQISSKLNVVDKMREGINRNNDNK